MPCFQLHIDASISFGLFLLESLYKSAIICMYICNMYALHVNQKPTFINKVTAPWEMWVSGGLEHSSLAFIEMFCHAC